MSTYSSPPGFFDELFEPDGAARPYARQLADSLETIGSERMRAAGERRDAIFLQQGITFDVCTDDGPGRDRPFPLDLVPRVLPADDWAVVKPARPAVWLPIIVAKARRVVGRCFAQLSVESRGAWGQAPEHRFEGASRSHGAPPGGAACIREPLGGAPSRFAS